MLFNMIYYQSSFTKNPFNLLIPHWILAYVLDAAFEQILFIHPLTNYHWKLHFQKSLGLLKR